MAKCASSVIAMTIVVVVVVVATPCTVNAAITCEQVTNWLTPCISYGLFGGMVDPACCEGMKALNAASKTTEDRRAQCNCVKEGAARIPGLNYDRVNELPGICGTVCPYKLTYDLDCSKVN